MVGLLFSLSLLTFCVCIEQSHVLCVHKHSSTRHPTLWYCINLKDDKFTVLFTYHQFTSHDSENVDTSNYFRSITHKQQIKLEALIIIFRSRLNLLKPKAKRNWLKSIFWLFIICLASGVVEDEVSSSFSSSLPSWGKSCRSRLPWLFVLSGILMCDMPSGTAGYLY